MLSSFLSAVVVDVATKLAIDVLSGLLHVGDVVVISKAIERLINKFRNRKEAF